MGAPGPITGGDRCQAVIGLRDGRCERVVRIVACGPLLLFTVQRSVNLLCDNYSGILASVVVSSADHAWVYLERMKSLIDRRPELEAVPCGAAG